MSLSLTMPTIALFGFTATANTVPQLLPEWMQYGAFGLCCVLVLYLMYQINDMGKIIRNKDEQIVELMKKDIQSRNTLSQLLQDRPCVSGDHRSRQ